jgi:hypothetical protein
MVEHILTAPIPLYQNVPAQPQYYKPSRFVISNVTLGQTTVVTATATMNYVIGQLVRLIIPRFFGCRQLNEVTGYVISLPAANQVEIAINSAGGNPYSTNTSPNQPQIVAVGDVNNGYQAFNGNPNNPPIIPGSFINISPL